VPYAEPVASDPVSRPGRPRRFSADEELQRLYDAAFEQIRTKGYADVTVADVLAEADMSTRSFYRHFASKDELLASMFRRDADRFADALARRVSTAATPAAAVVTWIDEILGFGSGRPRARRAAVLGSPEAMRALPVGELAHARELLLRPLTDALASGDFTITDAALDASFISAATWEASGQIGFADSRQRDAIRSSVLAFIGRALGVNL
jgi:AcrR family transcriptional regulator